MSDIMLKSNRSTMMAATSAVRSVWSGLRSVLSAIAAAGAVANAVENRRKPDARDLKELGLSHVEFSRYY